MTLRPALFAPFAIAALLLAGCGGDEPELVSAEGSAPTATALPADPTPTAASQEPEAEPTAPAPPEPPAAPVQTELTAADFTEVYGCGFGFWAGNVDQTAGIFVQFTDVEAATAGQVPPVGAVPSVIWSGRVDLGADLFSNWCDDVIEPGEPEPVTTETWEIVDAAISIEGTPPVQSVGSLTVTLTGITLESPDGEQVVIGDLTLTNDTWGAFAG